LERGIIYKAGLWRIAKCYFGYFEDGKWFTKEIFGITLKGCKDSVVAGKISHP